MNFGIHVDDNSTVLSELAVNNNEKTVKLHNWQDRAIHFFFSHNNKTMYEVATGSGKTFLAITILKEIHLREPNAKCLIVVPKNIILSDGWHRELWNAGYNLPDIGVYYGFAKEYGKKVTITNMQSLSKVAIEIFDVVIYDECHNYGTKALIKYIEYPFKYKIGLSATIERRDNTHWDILKAFDYNVFTYTPGQAIQDGVLNPFNFYNISVELDEDTMEEYELITSQLNVIMKTGGGFNKLMKSKNPLKFKMLSLMNKRKQLVNNYYRKFDVARAICQKHNDKKIIIFNQFNAQTSKLYWHLLEVGIKGRIIHSDVKTEEREKSIQDFKEGRCNVILTSRVLDEGWNVPSVEVAIIMAGDSTNKQTVQRMGRVLRRKKTNSLLYQIYCKNTIEDDNARERTKLFKDLSSEYEDYIYKRNDGELIL